MSTESDLLHVADQRFIIGLIVVADEKCPEFAEQVEMFVAIKIPYAGVAALVEGHNEGALGVTEIIVGAARHQFPEPLVEIARNLQRQLAIRICDHGCAFSNLAGDAAGAVPIDGDGCRVGGVEGPAEFSAQGR